MSDLLKLYVTFQIDKKYELLCSDRHAKFLMKLNKDPSDYRPDIVHQVNSNLCFVFRLVAVLVV